MIAGQGPMTAIVQQLFASPETLLSRKTIVVLAVGTGHLCTPFAFNNIREIDDFAKSMSGKKLVGTYDVNANIDANDKKFLTSFRTKQISRPNFFEIATDTPITLMDMAMANIDSHKPMTIVIPTALDVRQSAKYVVNGQAVAIPGSYVTYPHLNAFCELPAGTDRLKVELIGKPGTILSIRNIQVYQ